MKSNTTVKSNTDYNPNEFETGNCRIYHLIISSSMFKTCVYYHDTQKH